MPLSVPLAHAEEKMMGQTPHIKTWTAWLCWYQFAIHLVIRCNRDQKIYKRMSHAADRSISSTFNTDQVADSLLKRLKAQVKQHAELHGESEHCIEEHCIGSKPFNSFVTFRMACRVKRIFGTLQFRRIHPVRASDLTIICFRWYFVLVAAAWKRTPPFSAPVVWDSTEEP